MERLKSRLPNDNLWAKELIKWWIHNYKTILENNESIIDEFIWFNSPIKIDDKLIVKRWIDKETL